MFNQVPAVTTDDFVNFATDKPERKSRVINLSQYGPSYFGPEHAQVIAHFIDLAISVQSFSLLCG